MQNSSGENKTEATVGQHEEIHGRVGSTVLLIIVAALTGYFTLTIYQRLTEENTITIALAATSTVAKGVLILPKHKSVYIYSMTWPLNFPKELEKTELVNNYLALNIFEEYVSAYRKTFNFDKLHVTGQVFCLTPNISYSSVEWRELFEKTRSRLKIPPFQGDWKQGGGRIGKQIMNYFTGIDEVTNYIKGHLPGYEVLDVSEVKRSMLNVIAADVPGTSVGILPERWSETIFLLIMGLAVFVLGPVIGIVLAEGGYVVYICLSATDNDNPHQHRRERGHVEDSDDDSITIAVDATQQQGGGLLILPKIKTVYYYAFDWLREDGYNFPNESDKFESANALLALDAFESIIVAYKRKFNVNQLICKTDNETLANFANGMLRKRKKGKWGPLYERLKSRLNSYPFANSTWIRASSNVDAHINIADKLSRTGSSSLSKIPRSIFPNDPLSLLLYKDIRIHGLVVHWHFLQILPFLPHKHPLKIAHCV